MGLYHLPADVLWIIVMLTCYSHFVPYSYAPRAVNEYLAYSYPQSWDFCFDYFPVSSTVKAFALTCKRFLALCRTRCAKEQGKWFFKRGALVYLQKRQCPIDELENKRIVWGLQLF